MDNAQFDDLNARVDAYRGSDDDGVPQSWTPEHVQQRLVRAFDVLKRTPGRVGPSSNSNAWPAMIREFHELVDRQTREQMERDAAEVIRRKGERPSAIEIQLADEALSWCARYLADEPCLADALQRWAYATARDLNMAKILRKRCILVDAIRARRQKDQDAQQERQRSEVIAESTRWANERLSDTVDADRWGRIRANAIIRIERELERLGIKKRIKIRRQDVMPGKTFNDESLRNWRKKGAEMVAERLERDRIVVR